MLHATEKHKTDLIDAVIKAAKARLSAAKADSRLFRGKKAGRNYIISGEDETVLAVS